MKTIKTLILTGFGINSEKELHWCFEKAGSEATTIHLNDLITKKYLLKDFQILAFPGGFSYGDHIAAGKILANKIKIHLGEEIAQFLTDKKPILGICNGFQMLVKLGLLPFPTFKQEVTLTHNDNHQFENRWVRLKINSNSQCIWTQRMNNIYLPIRHGEGKLVTSDEKKLFDVQKNNLDVLQYVNDEGLATQVYPHNPNGSEGAIAGLTDPSGLVFGLMPHPEAFRWRKNAPGWKTRNDVFNSEIKNIIKDEDGDGMAFFYNAVNYVKKK